MIFKRFIMVNTILLLLFLLVSSDLISQEITHKNDFRNTRWGMKKDKVLSTEKNNPIGAVTVKQYFTAYYTGEIASMKADYGYIFLDDVLVRAYYIFSETHLNSNEFINDYNRLKKILTRKYGSPIKSGSYWHKDLYKNNPQHYGMAVSVGHLVFQSDWVTDRTLIRLTLKGDNFNINSGVVYTSKLHKELIDKAKEKSDEEGL